MLKMIKIIPPNKEGRFYRFNKKVGLIAPSYSMSRTSLMRAVQRLSDMGFTVYYDKLPKFLKWSGSAKQRGDQITNFFNDDLIDIIWCLRGGMGCASAIPHIDFNIIKNNNKLFIGYSDITSLQLAFQKYSDFSSYQFYMPGVKTWLTSEEDFLFLESVLNQQDFMTEIKEEQILLPGVVEGELVGGCLDLICSSIGTPHEIDTDGKILLFEDVGISPERYTDELTHMWLAGKFDNIKGLIVAKIIKCKGALDYFKAFLDEIKLDIPIIVEFDSGHTLRKIPIPLGSRCKIDTDSKTIFFKALKYDV